MLNALKPLDKYFTECQIASVIAFFQRLNGYFFVKTKENRIAFMSIPDYSDNAKALSDYLLLNDNENIEIIWFVNEPEKLREKYKGLPIKFYSNKKVNGCASWDAVKAAYSCKKIIFTHGFFITKKWCKSEQDIINLWHGCGYKASEKAEARKMNEFFDYVLVPGSVFVKLKADFFTASSETVLPIGYPRYDVLLKETKTAEDYVKQLLADNKKFVVWMPTFRKATDEEYPEAIIQQDFELPIVNSLEDLKKVNAFCRENKIILCIKRHPFQMVYSCETQDFSNLIFLSSSDFAEADIDLYAFLHYTDALISDYSSVAIDYLLLDKPIAFALDDFEAYKNARGFVFDNPLDYMPGHHLYTFEDMLEFLKAVSEGKDPYKTERDRIMPEVHNPCENYCERVWETVKKLDENK